MRSSQVQIFAITCAFALLAAAAVSRRTVLASGGSERIDASRFPEGMQASGHRGQRADGRYRGEAVQNIVGLYLGSVSGTSSNCTPQGGGSSFGPLAVTINVYAQNGISFSALGTSDAATSAGVPPLPMNGTVSSDGAVTGTFDYEFQGVTFSGTLSGNISSGKLSWQLTGTTSVTVPNAGTFGCDVTDDIVASLTTPRTNSDMSISGQPSVNTAASGTRISYSYTVMNAGPNEAPAPVFSDPIPDGATLASVTASAGSVSSPGPGGTGQVTVLFSTFAPGQSATISITLNIIAASGTTLSNTASAGSDSGDPNPGNNSVTTNTPISGGALVTLEWDQPIPTASSPTPPPINVRVVPVIPRQPGPTIQRTSNGEFPASGSCTLVDINIYKSDQPNVQTVPENLWATVPPDQAQATLASAPGGSFYVLTNVWNCGGTLVESGGSNEASVPAGPTITKVKGSAKLKIIGSSYSAPVSVFVDGIPFQSPANLANPNKVVQKGLMTNGMTIMQYITSGRTVLVTVENTDGGLGTFSFTAP